MSDELFISGKDYVSSKRAAETSGYAQDYIGQLARGGLIDAQRVGGLWYVSMESLNNYGQSADLAKKLQPIIGVAPQDPESLVNFDGKDYISASRASKLTSYNQDYIGQLARANKILSRQIGNRWYVEREGLLQHKKEKDGLLAAVQAESVGLKRATEPAEQRTFQDSKNTSTKLLSYHSENRDLMAQPVRDGIASVQGDVSPEVKAPHQIPIRVIAQQLPPMPRAISRSFVPSQKPASGKTISYAIKAGAALTVVIVLAYGITTFKEDSMYASAAKSGYESLRASSFVASAAAKGESFFSLIENMIAPEMSFERH